MSENNTELIEEVKQIFTDFLERQKAGAGANFNPLDPGVVGKAYAELTKKMLENPQQLVQAQIELQAGKSAVAEASARRAAEIFEAASGPDDENTLEARELQKRAAGGSP